MKQFYEKILKNNLFFYCLIVFTFHFSFGQTDRFWSGNGPNDNISESGNWYNGNPNSGDNLYFNNTINRQWAFSNYGAGSFFGNLIVYNNAGNIRFYGDDSYFLKIENFDSPDILEINNTTIGSRIGNDIEINPVGTGGITILSTNLTIDNSGGARELKVFGNNNLTINAIISDTNGTGGRFNLLGNATVTFTADNTYSGTTTLNSGRLILEGSVENSDVTVESGATLEINSSVIVKSLTVNTGGIVIVNAGNTLTVANDLTNNGTSFTINSTSLTYGGLIVNGTATGDITYNRFVNGSPENDLVAPPVSQTWSDFLSSGTNTNDLDSNAGQTEFAFGPFQKSTGDYINYESTTTATLTPGIGYRAATDSGTTLAFTGSVATGNVDAPIENTTGGVSFAEWNLIGNPYPSYISAELFLQNAINQGLLDENAVGIYGYDGDTSDGWKIIHLNNIAGELIAPGQGFYVAATSDGDIQFTPSMRSVGSSDDFITTNNDSALSFVKLKAYTTNQYFTTEFYFNANASLGLNPGYDVKVWGDSAPSFALYSHLVQDDTGIPFMVQTLKDTDISNVTIPLGINANAGEQLTFSIDEMQLPSEVNVYLEDTADNTTTLLNTADYVLTPSTNLTGTGRFYITFTNTTLSTNNNTLDTVNVITDNTRKVVLINGQLEMNTEVRIIDIQGRVVTSKKLNNSRNSHSIDVSHLTSGVYIVQLSNNTSNKAVKIILK